MNKDDILWKGILENLFEDFLHFYFPNADHLFDMERKFQFMDKELEQLFPVKEMKASKFVDKLVKVYRKDGSEDWILIHIEIQGYKDKDFSKRIYTYWYRIVDKYNKPVTTFVIFTDTNKKFKPHTYQYECLGTKVTFEYNTYKIIEQDERVLEKSNNPFATVILTVLLAIKSKKLTDEDLFHLKFSLAKKLLQKRFSKKKIGNLLIFLQLYVRFDNSKYSTNFDKAVAEITKNKKTMGIRELVLERARQEGLKIGESKGIAKGKAEGKAEGKAIVVKNLIMKMGLSDVQAADIADVSTDFVKKIREELKK